MDELPNLPAYCTNAISEPTDSRVPLDASSTREASLSDYGSFYVLYWKSARLWRAWIWRHDADDALFFAEGASVQAWKRAQKAVEEQKLMDKALNHRFLKTPAITDWSVKP